MNAAVLGCEGRAAWTLPGEPASVGRFRGMARAVATDSNQAEAAALCVSELVTNALVHTRSGLPGGSVTVCFDAEPDSGALVIWVQDEGARALVPDRAGTGLPGAAECGYGLGIVAAVAAGWGTVQADDGRRVTWCVIAAGDGQ